MKPADPSISSGVNKGHGRGGLRCKPARQAQDRNRNRKQGQWKSQRQPHGLTYNEAQAAKADAGKCSICGCTDYLVIDHAHETMVQRGVLCRKRNVGITMLRDDPARLRAAAE